VALRTAIAEVRWPMLDDQNREICDERSTYTLRTNDDGELEIRVTPQSGTAREKVSSRVRSAGAPAGLLG
jgi:hypothetical protein